MDWKDTNHTLMEYVTVDDRHMANEDLCKKMVDEAFSHG